MLDLLKQFVDFILHIDVHLGKIIADYGLWTYGILFLIIFAETGFVVTPFLPGDSLLFAAGVLCAIPETGLNVHLMALLLFAAAVIGDTVNYWIGAKIGPKVFTRDDSIFLRKKHLERAHAFFEKFGGRAIILARFVPIVRTFVPFVAGVGKMTYSHFITYNIVGGFAWIYLFIYLGVAFTKLFPGTPDEILQGGYLKYIVIPIILLSLLPIVVEFIRAYYVGKKQRVSTDGTNRQG